MASEEVQSKLTNVSFTHYKFTSEFVDERLDFVYQHPKFDKIRRKIASTRFIAFSNLVQPKSMDYGLTASGQKQGTIRFINIENLTRHGTISLENIRYVENAPSKLLLQENDILFSRSRQVGVCAVVDKKSKQSTFGSYIIRFKPRLERVIPLFLAKFVNSVLGQAQVEYLKTGSTGKNINTDQILRIQVPDLSLQEQQNILNEVLLIEAKAREYDAQEVTLTDKNRNLILKELGIKTTLRPKLEHFWVEPKEMSNRLDYVRNHPLARNIIRMLNEKNAVPLGKLLKEDIEYGINASSNEIGKIPFVNIKQVNPDGTVHSEGIKYVNDAPSRKLLNPNDILICRSRAVGTCAMITEREKGFTFGSYILRTQLKENVDLSPRYTVSFVNSELGRIQVKYLQTGSEKFAFTKKTGRGGGNNINPNQIKKIRILLLPDKKRERKIIKALERTLEVLKTIRTSKEKKWKEAQIRFSQNVDSALKAD